jgi:hypothetical protein
MASAEQSLAVLPRADALLKLAGALLVATVWISAGLFGAYIVAFYAGAVPAGVLPRWNTHLPGLYDARTPLATFGIAAHFTAGGIILLLGPIQLFGRIRAAMPALHRWTGRVYVLSAFLAGLGGLSFIAGKGTIGGGPMNAGFGLYGALMVVAAVETYRHARARRIEIHRAWAIRLFALAVGSWLYRIEYGFWEMFTGGIGTSHDFRGPVDVVMAFFFYLPNLFVAEVFIRARRFRASAPAKAAAALVLLTASFLLVVGTYYFTRYYWAPGIATGVAALVH